MVVKKKQTKAAKKPAQIPQKIRFTYQKSPLFRVIKVTGAIGGVTPTGEVNVTFYGDRLPIPDWTEQDVTSEGTLGPKVTQAPTKGHIAREVEATLTLSAPTAKAIGLWLLQHADSVIKQQEVTTEQIITEEEGH